MIRWPTSLQLLSEHLLAVLISKPLTPSYPNTIIELLILLESGVKGVNFIPNFPVVIGLVKNQIMSSNKPVCAGLMPNCDHYELCSCNIPCLE